MQNRIVSDGIAVEEHLSRLERRTSCVTAFVLKIPLWRHVHNYSGMHIHRYESSHGVKVEQDVMIVIGVQVKHFP